MTDACKTCSLNKQQYHPPGGRPAKVSDQKCPLAQHREFKGIVAHKVTRAVVYDDLRPKFRSPYPSLKNLINKCWKPDELERPGFSSVVDALDTAIRNEVADYTRSSADKAGGGGHHPSFDRRMSSAAAMAGGPQRVRLVGGGDAPKNLG